MKTILFFVLTLIPTYTFPHFLKRSKATHAAQKGDFTKSHELLSSLITKKPDDPELLYDAGVVAFERKKFDQAEAYFKNSAQNKNASDVLKQDAYFNWGNTNVEQKKLEDAIARYEEVLKLNPEHQEAKHNLEVVKKMLEEQKKQNEQQDQQDNKENSENKNDQQNENKDQNKKSDDNQQSDQQKNDQGDQSESEKKDQQEQGEQGRDKERDQQSDKNEKPETQNDSSQDSQPEKDQQQQKDQGQHDESPEKPDSEKTDSQDKQSEAENQDGQEQQEANAGAESQQPNQYDEQVMKILQAIEKKDAQASKKMMAAHVKQATGSYDKNQNNY